MNIGINITNVSDYIINIGKVKMVLIVAIIINSLYLSFKGVILKKYWIRVSF